MAKQNKSNKRKSNKQNKWVEPSPSASIYNGPILRRMDTTENDLHTILVPYTEFISSDGTGKIKLSYSDAPSSFPDWSSLAGIFDEYRPLGLRLEYFPDNRYSKTTTICRPLITVVDRDDASTLTSYALAVSYGSAKKRSLEDPFAVEIKMNGIEDADFMTTASPVARNYIKLYADGLSASIEYGMIVLYALLQFRGRN